MGFVSSGDAALDWGDGGYLSQIFFSGPEWSSLRRMMGHPRLIMVDVAWWMWNVSTNRRKVASLGKGRCRRIAGLRILSPLCSVSG